MREGPIPLGDLTLNWRTGQAHYGQIQEFMHSTQGNLIDDERTYCAYVSQIRELGTRESVPYQQVIQAIENSLLFLERREEG